jgi:two-component system, NtrC family, C4-dicarboxylate transport response regulator DctD
VVTLQVPPLSARREDVPLLFLRLLTEAASRHRSKLPEVSPSMIEQLVARDWPGNVRELRNAADRFALGLNEGALQDEPLGRLFERVADFERREIEAALLAHRGNLKPVYESLGLSRKTLWEKMQKHGLEKSDFGPVEDSGQR